MLVLSRKVGEKITIGDNVDVYVVENRKGLVKIGIEAPKEISVVRDDVNRLPYRTYNKRRRYRD